MKKLALLLMLLGPPFLSPPLLSKVCYAEPTEEVERALEATCKVKGADGGRGTGCAFSIQNDEVHILTNYHVAEGRAVACEFWNDGYQSIDLPAQTKWFAYQTERDLNVIAIPVAAFGGRLPPIIPLAPRGTMLYQGMTIYSAGCDDGQYPKLWKGHITQPNGASTVQFEPTSIPGQSGSSVFARNAEGRLEIVACIAWKDPYDRYGIAMTNAEIWAAFDSTPRIAGWHYAKGGKKEPLYEVKKPPKQSAAKKRLIFTGETVAERQRREKIETEWRSSVCVHGVSLSEWCSQCQVECPGNSSCPGGTCPTVPPSEYRRGFGFGFGWGGPKSAPSQPYQAPPYSQPYSQPDPRYGGSNPGYNPYPQQPPSYTTPGTTPNGQYVLRSEMETFANAVDDKIEATRAETLGRLSDTDSKVSRLEQIAEAVKDIPSVKEATSKLTQVTEELKQNQSQLNANLGKVDDRVDQVDSENDRIEDQTASAIDNTNKTILDKLKDKVSISEVIERYKQAKEEGASAGAEAAKVTALSVIREKLEGIGPSEGWTMGKVLAGTLGVSGPIGVGLAGLGYFLAKRRPISKIISRRNTVVRPNP